MGLIRKLKWVNCSKKQCKSLFWRVRAAVRKAVKNGGKQNVKFQYDPSSYALNFDDGCYHFGGGTNGKNFGGSKTMWVYVVWVETQS